MNKIKLLYDVREIYKVFKEALRINIYDAHTMEWYINTHLKDLSVHDLEIMLETIKEDVSFSDSLNSAYGTSLNFIIMLLSIFIASFTSILVLFSSYLIPNGDSTVINAIDTLFYSIIFVILALLTLVVFDFFSRIIKKSNTTKLYKLIQIIILIKKNRTTAV